MEVNLKLSEVQQVRVWGCKGGGAKQPGGGGGHKRREEKVGHGGKGRGWT